MKVDYTGDASELYLPIDVETIFKVVEPVSKLPKPFFGYLGVILRNTTTDRLQCHVCGEWFKCLDVHVFFKHQLLSRDYKQKFSLPLRFPLCGRSTSKLRSNSAIKYKSLGKYLKGSKKWKSGSRVLHKKSCRYGVTNRAYQNKNNVCPEQLNKRFQIVADMVGREPTCHDLEHYDYGCLGTLVRRFGSLNNYRKQMGYRVNLIPKKCNETQAIAALRKYYQKYKVVPKSYVWKRSHFKPSYNTILRYFGSWHRSLVSAGLI